MTDSTTSTPNQSAACLQENLARALNIVSPAVASRSTLPALTYILLTAANGQVSVTATNLDLAVTCKIGAIVEGEWGLALPARELGELIGSLPQDRVDLKFSPETQALNIRCLRASANIKGIAAGEFPKPPALVNAIQLSLEAETLREMIKQTTFSAASDNARPILAGVLTELAQTGITFAAADGFRLSVRSASQTLPLSERLRVVIPAPALNLVAKIAAMQEDPFELAFSERRTHVSFRQGNVEVLSSLIEGNFPDFGQLVPPQHTTRVVTNAADFLAAVKRSIVFARSQKGIVRLQAVPANGTASKVVVSAVSAERGDYTDELDAGVEGNPVQIAFNGQFLAEWIEQVKPTQLILETTSEAAPGVFKVVGREDYLHLIMPMHAK